MLAAFAAAAASTAQAAERRHIVTDFDRVQVDGPFEVVLATGGPNSAVVSGSSSAVERVSIDVQGRTLRVRPNRSAWGGYPAEGAGPVRVALGTHHLRAASVSGSGSIGIDKVRAMRFDIAVSGSGRISVAKLEADTLTLGLLGAGQIELAGSAKELRATIQGTGGLKADGLVVEDARINADTAGTIGLTVRRSADITATGPGDTRIFGSPACTVKDFGAGRVVCGN